MGMSIKYAIAAHDAKMTNSGVSINNSFDMIMQPLFPIGLEKIAIVLAMNGVEKNTMFEMRLNGPKDELLSKGEFGMMATPSGIPSKKVISIEKFIVHARGKYTMDILEKRPEGLKFVGSTDLFVASYPPKRRFSSEEIDKILADDSLIKSVKTEFKAPGMEEGYKLQINLDDSAAIDEGYNPLPGDSTLEIGDKKYDLTGLKRQAELMFGRPIPKKKSEEE